MEIEGEPAFIHPFLSYFSYLDFPMFWKKLFCFLEWMKHITILLVIVVHTSRRGLCHSVTWRFLSIFWRFTSATLLSSTPSVLCQFIWFRGLSALSCLPNNLFLLVALPFDFLRNFMRMLTTFIQYNRALMFLKKKWESNVIIKN